MSLGLGVFLSSLFLGTVLLYLRTKGEWNWRLIVKRISRAAVLSLALVGATLFGVSEYQEWEARPQVVTSLKSIAIGDRYSDTVFKHGHFKKRETPATADSESYDNDAMRVSVTVSRGLVNGVIYYCRPDGDYEDVNGVSCGSTGEEIVRRFGREVRMQCRAKREIEQDELMRVFDHLDYGVRYFLEKNRVIGFYVMNSDRLRRATGKNWASCT